MESHNSSELAPKETEEFWQKHYASLKSSGLKRKTYCRQNNISYDRFGYWICRWNRGYGNKLISVKLKSENLPASESVLCTLDFKCGHALRIYNTEALIVIL